MTAIQEIANDFQTWANQPDRKTEAELRKRFDQLSREIERLKPLVALDEQHRQRGEALQKARNEASRRIAEIGKLLAQTKREFDAHSKALADLPIEQIPDWSRRNRELADLLASLTDALRIAEAQAERARIDLENYSRQLDPKQSAILSRLVLLEERLAASNNGQTLSGDDFRRIAGEIQSIKQQLGG